jgi:hypothetical protein
MITNNMEDLIKIIISKGYQIVREEYDIVSFVNEDVKYCCILVNSYDDDNDVQMDKIYELSKELQKEYIFAEKGTILIIKEISEDREKVESDVYHFLKTYPDKLDVLPTKKDAEITVNFLPIEGVLDTMDYRVNPYLPFDGIAMRDFLIFINKVETNVIVRYPRIFEGVGYLRYVSGKLYNVEFKK